ncbi:LAQU0S02e05204g1_1 [Lachancea quebecensis]|uniref:Putative lipoate-protein ligase A n=1 Tax=Lachancea quebecensis TaxID=1654605 RepID=A0A0P1KQM2_9SACH|nr:LAQU0S02e05204g1_1 [Lachancea quebecensis]
MLRIIRTKALSSVPCLKGRCVRYYVGTQTPLELNPAAQDERYADLNNMYTEMFAGDDVKSSVARNKDKEGLSEIDQLNAEISETYDFMAKPISGQELEQIVKSPGRFILKSLSNNPYYNLALEDYVFLNTPAPRESPFSSERLLFYVNDKCVVIGKNQNPWRELFLDECSKKGYKFVRRKSGGGAVVHDLGNVNYSYLTSRDLFRREYFNKQIVRWLTQTFPGVNVSLSPRGDINLVNQKVSGSAFKVAKGKSYHHGTMLINADITSFSGLLKPECLEGIEWSGGSIESVRSRVANLSQMGVENTDEFVDLCSEGFKSLMNENMPVYWAEESCTTNAEILKTIRHLQSDEWLYDSGPNFTVSFLGRTINVEKGIIKDSTNSEGVGSHFRDYVSLLKKNKHFKTGIEI